MTFSPKHSIALLLALLLYGFSMNVSAALPLKSKAVVQKSTPTKPVGISVTSAEATLTGYMKQIDQLSSESAALVTKEAVVQRYIGIFQGLGVINPQEPAENHANVWLHWDGYCNYYYNKHKEALQRSLDVIRSQGFAKPEDMRYLEKGMAAWSTAEKGIKEILVEDLDAFGHERGYGVLTSQMYQRGQIGFRDTPYADQIHMYYTVQHTLGEVQSTQCQKMYFSAIDDTTRIQPPEDTTLHHALID